ncbi:helix-turn-helix domain-containing protein [Streptomyces sp. CB00316]|uniref:helix-turn-helix domain-containing protein n=1 Tax=Streptomyces sp. CB00316 TaxID=1703932 RepID=UPI001F47268B|nr:helix-turn-helix transcriptional regulator [Streptomyces sp. CB00316]
MDPADSAAGAVPGGRSAGTRLPPGGFGVVLATLRARRGWSVRDAARRANVSEGQICNLESGLRNPTPAVAAACDAAFGTGGELVELAGTGRHGARSEDVVEERRGAVPRPSSGMLRSSPVHRGPARHTRLVLRP